MKTIEHELRLGNILVYKGKAARVTTVNTTPNAINIRVVGEESSLFFLAPKFDRDLKGLPVDDTVLMKLGLISKDTYNGYLYTYKKDDGDYPYYQLDVEYDTYEGCWAATVCAPKGCISHIYTKYLHELQNALVGVDFDEEFISGFFDKVKRGNY